MNTNENIQTPQTNVANPDISVANPQTVKEGTQTNETAKKNLSERLKETSQAAKANASGKKKLKTGTQIEDYYKADEKKPLKRKPGRPRNNPDRDYYIYQETKQELDELKQKVEEEEKPQSVIDAGQTDKITPIINHTAIPLLAKKFKRLPKECQLTKDQLNEIASVMPANSLMTTPSWLNYGITLILITMTNFMLAEKITATPEEKQILQHLRTQMQDPNHIPTIEAEPVN